MSNYDSGDSLSVYMREIAETPLLTPLEEVELAKRIQAGDKDARTHMIKANLRLVVKIARDYSGYGLPLADLISEGNIGLVKAVERFDPEKGGKLSTYGSWWIKQSIKRALSNQSKTIRLPVHLVDKIARMRRISNMLSESLGRDPSNEELGEELGLPARKVAMLKQVSQRTTSLDEPTGEEGKGTYNDVIEDEKTESPLDALVNKNLHGQLDGFLDILNERESQIIDARFGLSGRTPMTLEEIGRDLGVTRERIRQLQNAALEKMRRALSKKEKPLPHTI